MTGLPLTPAEAAQALKLTEGQVMALARRGELAFVRLPSGRLLKPRRIQAWSVERLLGYDAADEPYGEAPTEAPTPERGHRRPPQGSLASASVGGSGAVPRQYGPAPTDVVVRRVQTRGRGAAQGRGIAS